MVQEDTTNAKVWHWNFGPLLTDWTHVATVTASPTNTTINDPGESSGIIDMSAWLGAGWWALDCAGRTRMQTSWLRTSMSSSS